MKTKFNMKDLNKVVANHMGDKLNLKASESEESLQCSHSKYEEFRIWVALEMCP